MPQQSDAKRPQCTLNLWSNKTKVRSQIMMCQTCGVNLCITCYAKFHKIVEVDELRQAVQTTSETNNTDAFNDVESNAL